MDWRYESYWGIWIQLTLKEKTIEDYGGLPQIVGRDNKEKEEKLNRNCNFFYFTKVQKT